MKEKIIQMRIWKLVNESNLSLIRKIMPLRVCAARKIDIEWQVMLDWRLQKAKVRFKSLEKLITTGERDKDVSGTITSDGILFYGELIYGKDESEENYLQCMGFDTSIHCRTFKAA